MIVLSLGVPKENDHRDELLSYFACEAGGLQSGRACLKDDFTSSYIVVSVIPLICNSNIMDVTIIYIIDITTTKRIIKQLCSQ